MVQDVRNWVRGSSTRFLVTGAEGIAAAATEFGAGAGVGAVVAQASNSMGPAIHHVAVRARSVICVIPQAAPLGSRDLMESRRPISRVLSVPTYASVHRHRTVIPLGVQSPTRSSSLPAARRLATSLRDGSSLAAYLALLRLGFTEPPSLPKARWALTPPFHPYRLTGCPRRRRFAFCCTVRRTKLTPHAPRRYLAVYPVEPGLSSVPELAPKHRDHPAGDRSMSTRNITSPQTSSYGEAVVSPTTTSYRHTVTAG